MKKTIIDVARELGVSPSTISKIVNNKGRISAQTRERVLNYVKTSGYVAMSNARILSSKKSWTIGVIYSDIQLVGFEHPFFSRILQSFKSYVESIGYEIVMIVSKLGDNELTYLQWCQNKKVDGVLIVMGNINNPNIIELVNSDIPTISTDIEMNNLHCVISDDRAGVRLMMDYAIKNKIRDIVCVTGPLTSRSFQTRSEEFRTLMIYHKYPFQESDIYVTHGFGAEHGSEIAAEIIQRPIMPKLVLIFSDVLAYGVIRVLESYGYRVPEDIEVIGFDDIDFTKHFVPSLSTIRQDTVTIGTIAAKELLKAIEEKPLKIKQTTHVPVQLILRETTKMKN